MSRSNAHVVKAQVNLEAKALISLCPARFLMSLTKFSMKQFDKKEVLI